MGIGLDEVHRIARLARLRVTREEAVQLARDLDRIVAFVASLQEVDLPAGAESLTYFGRDVNRADDTREGLGSEEALRNAPLQDGEYFLVPKIVEKEAP